MGAASCNALKLVQNRCVKTRSCSFVVDATVIVKKQFGGRGACFRRQRKFHRQSIPQYSTTYKCASLPNQFVYEAARITSCVPNYSMSFHFVAFTQCIWSLSRKKRNQKKHALNGNPEHYPGRLLGPGRRTHVVRRWRREGVPDFWIRSLWKEAGCSMPRIGQILRTSVATPQSAARASTVAVGPHFPEVHAGASCKRLRWSAGALRPLLTFRNTVTAERSCKRQMLFAPHVEQMRSKQHPEHNVIISRQQLLRETVVRRAGQWLEQWYPTTISQSTIGRIVDLSQQWNVRVENIIFPTPPDGNCLLYSIMACRKSPTHGAMVDLLWVSSLTVFMSRLKKRKPRISRTPSLSIMNNLVTWLRRAAYA